MSGPLLGWDFFMDAYYRRLQRLEDLQRLKQFAADHDWSVAWDLDDLILKKGKVALVTDPTQTIRFATENIVEMNGYLPNEIIGRRPTMFQGKDTPTEARSRIRTAISTLKPFYVTLINYRKDGSPYKCQVEGYAVFKRERKELSHFIAFEKLALDAPGAVSTATRLSASL